VPFWRSRILVALRCADCGHTQGSMNAVWADGAEILEQGTGQRSCNQVSEMYKKSLRFRGKDTSSHTHRHPKHSIQSSILPSDNLLSPVSTSPQPANQTNQNAKPQLPRRCQPGSPTEGLGSVYHFIHTLYPLPKNSQHPPLRRRRC
jgi:hypothetical protein